MASKLGHQSGYVIIMPAYNEAQSIGHALDALQTAIDATPHHLRRILICLNGCNDDTERIVKEKINTTLRITIIKSPQGYRTALNKLFQHAIRHYPNTRIVKLDADSVICPDTLSLLLNQLDTHAILQVIGGHPLPLYSHELRPLQRLLARTFSLRSLYPQSQIATADVRHYHPLAMVDPQPTIGEYEPFLKPYFHGRIWAARSSTVLSMLTDSVIGDDIFLAANIYRTFGPGSIRVLYNANVLCAPNHSLKRHWMVYKRIHEDKQRVEAIPEYTDIQRAQKTRLNWRYILLDVKLSDKILFLLYGTISNIEELSFRHTSYRDSYWQYKKKESL
jgi:glycosyltransferase involved in cell wall biosynthesis